MIDDMRPTQASGVILEQDGAIEVRERTPGYRFVVGAQLIKPPLYGRGHFNPTVIISKVRFAERPAELPSSRVRAAAIQRRHARPASGA